MKPSGRIAIGIRGIAKKGERSDGRVLEANRIIIERKRADSTVVPTGVVIDECVSSNGRVLKAGRVEQHRRGAKCGIRIRPGTGEGQRSSAKTGVEIGVAG